MKALIKINRIKEGYKETLGTGTLFVDDVAKFDFCVLERPNLHNERNVSSIPAGIYSASKIRRGSNNKKAILLAGTQPRTEILIHSGNYYDDSEGCLLIGSRFTDVDHNGIYDVIESNDTVNTLFDLIPDNADLTVEIIKMMV